MNVLAFDIAYRTGWACTALAPPGLHWGSFGVEVEGEEGIGRGLSFFCRNLEKILVANPGVRCLAWEKPLPGTKHLASFDEFVRGATGLLRMTAFDRGWAVLPCDMKAVRRHFIGDGTRHDAKQQVWQRCKTLGYECKNDDESDAIATWDYAVGIMRLRDYAGKSAGFGGTGGGKIAAARRLGGHRRL